MTGSTYWMPHAFQNIFAILMLCRNRHYKCSVAKMSDKFFRYIDYHFDAFFP